MNRWNRIALVLGLVAAAIGAWAQPATAEQRGSWPVSEDYSTLHLQTRLGSFKLLNGTGRAQIEFTGTMLISQYEGKPLVVLGDLRKEYDDNGRQVYFGKGRVVLDGKWRGVQWFGRDMRAVWYGSGEARVSGEYDENLKTGEYWYEDPTDKKPWFTQGTVTLILPEPSSTPGGRRTPVERFRN